MPLIYLRHHASFQCSETTLRIEPIKHIIYTKKRILFLFTFLHGLGTRRPYNNKAAYAVVVALTSHVINAIVAFQVFNHYNGCCSQRVVDKW